MFVTDFAGSIYSARLDDPVNEISSSDKATFTGIAYAEIPQEK